MTQRPPHITDAIPTVSGWSAVSPVSPIVIVGLGQPAAGDDGVGLVVLERLRAGPWRPGVTLLSAANPLEAIDQLLSCALVVFIDAALTPSELGRVRTLTASALSRLAPPTSSHGLSLAQVLSLADALRGDAPLADVRLVTVGIGPPRLGEFALSPEVAAAVEDASLAVRAIVGRHP